MCLSAKWPCQRAIKINKLFKDYLVPISKISLSDKLLSMEMLATTLVSIFLISGSWFSLSYASDDNSKAIAELKVVQQSAKKDIASIKTDVAVLLSIQEKSDAATKARLTEISRSMQSVHELIQRIHIEGAR